MEKLGDEFASSVSWQLNNFFELFTKCWTINKIIEHPEGFSTEELCYWSLMYDFAKKRVDAFTKGLPNEAKTKVDAHIREVKTSMEKLESGKE